MIPKEAIEKAIGGGWRGEGVYLHPTEEKYYFENFFPLEKIALDPSFWKALGKALDLKPRKSWKEPGGRLREAGWIWEARRFYDLILQEKDTTEFWASLLQGER